MPRRPGTRHRKPGGLHVQAYLDAVEDPALYAYFTSLPWGSSRPTVLEALRFALEHGGLPGQAPSGASVVAAGRFPVAPARQVQAPAPRPAESYELPRPQPAAEQAAHAAPLPAGFEAEHTQDDGAPVSSDDDVLTALDAMF